MCVNCQEFYSSFLTAKKYSREHFSWIQFSFIGRGETGEVIHLFRHQPNEQVYQKIPESGIENFREKVNNKKKENGGTLKRDNFWEEEQVMGESREISRRFLRKFHVIFG